MWISGNGNYVFTVPSGAVTSQRYMHFSPAAIEGAIRRHCTCEFQGAGCLCSDAVRPAPKELSVRAKILEDGGPRLWSEFMEELWHLHLEAPASRRSVVSRLQSAYEAAIAKPLV
jgi:hypothetical protein